MYFSNSWERNMKDFAYGGGPAPHSEESKMKDFARGAVKDG